MAFSLHPCVSRHGPLASPNPARRSDRRCDPGRRAGSDACAGSRAHAVGTLVRRVADADRPLGGRVDDARRPRVSSVFRARRRNAIGRQRPSSVHRWARAVVRREWRDSRLVRFHLSIRSVVERTSGVSPSGLQGEWSGDGIRGTSELFSHARTASASTSRAVDASRPSGTAATAVQYLLRRGAEREFLSACRALITAVPGSQKEG